MNYLSTEELENYIETVYKELIPLAFKDDIFEPLSVFFATGTPMNQPGDYCYSDSNGYHYSSTGDHGEAYPDNVTESLLEVTYWVIKTSVQLMSSRYKSKKIVPKQDIRRVMFQKVLEFFEVLGDEYKQRAELDINKTLEKYPYCDELFR